MRSRRRRAGRRCVLHRQLEVERLECRRFLAAELLIGTAWEEVWRGRVGEGSTVEAQFGAAADLNGDGRGDLVVGHSQGNQVLLRAADGSYMAGIAIPGPSLATWLPADIDNDGDPDLLATTEDTLRVLINAGVSAGQWGGFAERPGEPLQLPGAGGILDLEAADWSGDGRTDLALGTTEGIYVRLGQEDNTLGPAIAYPLSHGDQRRLVAGDFDQDGDLDLMSAASTYTGASLDLLVNDGQGIFEPRTTGARLSNLVRDLVAGDLDRDGDTDLVVAYQYAYDGNLNVLTNDGQGGFAGEARPLTVAGSPNQLALGDVDHDGDLDLAVSHYGGLHIPYSGAPGVSLFIGQANGLLGQRQYVHRSDARAVMIDSLPGGSEGTMTVLNWTGAIQVMRPVTPGLFPPHIETDSDDWTTPAAQNIVATGDWDGDGRDDMIQVTQRFGGPVVGISLGVAQPDGSYEWTELPLYEDGQSWIISELTGDDRPDVGVMRYSSQTFVVLPQADTGAIGSPIATKLAGNYWHDGQGHDLNQDGLTDLLLQGDTGSVRALFGAGSGQFALGPVIVMASEMRVADLNGDTRLDLAVVVSGNSLRTLHGQSDGTFQEAFRVATDANSYFQVWEDVTSDGRVDVILSSNSTLESRIFTGSADGTFHEAVGSPLRNSGYLEPRFPDVNLDGRNDLVIVAGQEGRLLVWITNADGSLSDPATTQIPRESYPYLHQDINGDQFFDFVLASQTQATVLLGRGDGTFVSAIDPLRVTSGLAHVSVTADYSGDDRNDLLILSSAGLRIWVWETDDSLVEFFELPVAAPEFWISRTEDFNGDAIEDFIYVEANTNRSHVIVSGTASPFIDAFSFPAESHVIGFADFSGDGLADALTQTWTGGPTIWRNVGDWSFVRLDNVLPGLGAVVVTDLDGDGLADLVGQVNDELTAWLNVGGASFIEYFTVHLNGSVGFDASSNTIAQGDLNHDGQMDVVIGWAVPGPGQRLTLLLSEEDGSLARPLTYVFPKPFNLANVVLGDVDADGDLDITLEGREYMYGGGAESEITRRGVIINQAEQYWPVGDSNRDGRFNSADLVAVFAAGEYEDSLGGNSTWLDGDWNGDGDFTSQDLVLAFQLGTYVTAARALDAVDVSDIVAHLSDADSASRKFTRRSAVEPSDGQPCLLKSCYET